MTTKIAMIRKIATLIAAPYPTWPSPTIVLWA
jgi:hypothetical protein